MNACVQSEKRKQIGSQTLSATKANPVDSLKSGRIIKNGLTVKVSAETTGAGKTGYCWHDVLLDMLSC